MVTITATTKSFTKVLEVYAGAHVKMGRYLLAMEAILLNANCAFHVLKGANIGF